MVIIIDAELADKVKSFTDAEWVGISNLAASVRDGNHYLIASRTLANALALSTQLNKREQAFYLGIKERFSTLASLANKVSTLVRVVQGESVKRVVSGDQIEIRIPLSYFSSLKNSRETLLLCENLDDCKIIEEMGRIYAHTNGLRAIQIKFEHLNGGGSTIAAVAEARLVESSQLLLCIVDSDRVTPNSRRGGTSLGVNRIFNHNPCPLAEFDELQARELENLLPNEFYSEYCGQSTASIDNLRLFEILVSSGNELPRLFIDIKKGLCLGDLFKFRRICSDYESVWKFVFENALNFSLQNYNDFLECIDGDSCCKPSNCTCRLVRGIEGNILEKGLLYLKRHGRPWIRISPPILKNVFTRIGKLSFDWGCAANVQSA